MRSMIGLLITLLFVLAGARDADVSNWNGWSDTAITAGVMSNGTVKYTRAFNLTDGEDLTLLVKVLDTTEVGFAADTFDLRYGFQGGLITTNTLGKRDTAWWRTIWIDTLVSDSLGKIADGYADSTLTWYEGKKSLDTTYVTGYSYQINSIIPSWFELGRYKLESISTANSAGSISVIFENHRIHHIKTGN